MLIFAVNIKGIMEQFLITADRFELIDDGKYVVFYKEKKEVGLFSMNNIIGILQVNSFEIYEGEGV